MPHLLGRAASLIVLLAITAGCSLKTMAVKTVANTLSDTGDVFTRDDDPELIRDATPFALKLYESLLESVPMHVPLLVTTCGGFTQYGYAFLEAEADGLDTSRRNEAVALRERALKHYLRARGYCLRAMDSRFGKGTSEALLQDPVAAVGKARKDDVPLLYWSAASWGAAISLGLDRPELAIDFPTVRALADRALALDPKESLTYLYLGEMLEKESDLRAAAGAYINARNLSPLWFRPPYRLGLVYGKLDRLGDAYYYLGRSFLLQDEDQRAIADYERAIKILGEKSPQGQVIKEELVTLRARRR